jgi:hypothetical protein
VAQPMMNKNFWTWVLLILLTTASYLFSERNGAITVLVMLLLFTVVKIGLVAFQFMELKKAHVAWIMMLGFVIAVYSVIVIAIHL